MNYRKRSHTMNKKIKWGIIGPGNIAEKFAAGINGSEGSELYALASRSEERAKAFAVRFGVHKIYNSYEALIDDYEVDIIYIATPHPFHKEQTALCLNGGKSVLCEKPLTVNYKDAAELISLAQKKNLFLMEGMWSRFQPVWQTIRQWVDSGKLGEIRMIRSDFSFAGNPDPKSRVLNPDLAGGGLLDVGIYPINFACWAMGTLPERVCGLAYLGKTGVDETASIAMRFPSGTMATISCGINVKGPCNAEICGTKGAILVDHFMHEAQKMTFITENNEPEVIKLPFDVNGFEYEIRHAEEALNSGSTESPIMPHTDTLGIMKIMDNLRQDWGLKYPFE